MGERSYLTDERIDFSALIATVARKSDGARDLRRRRPRLPRRAEGRVDLLRRLPPDGGARFERNSYR
jgi:hypothetical protein